MWIIPSKVDDEICNLAKKLSCDFIQAVRVDYEPAYDYNNCHNNVKIHKSLYGGDSVIGWYFVRGFNTIQAIRHTVWKIDNKLVDITPVKDKRTYNLFARSTNQIEDYSIPNCYIQSLDKYLSINIEEQKSMYYVYQLVDPRNSQPFYIGKGKGTRAKTHLWEIPATRNIYKENKIASIRKDGLEPIIEYIAENIIDENLAYEIETSIIKKYGRKWYDQDGTLTNICLDNRPPNHKGKTYEEIYGVKKATEQKKLRSDLQKERGGYGPKKHSEDTKNKISKSIIELHNNRDCSHNAETKKKIGISNKKYTGKLNKKSYGYILTSPEGAKYTLYGGEATEFCKKNNLSWSTLKMQIQKKWGIPKKGKTKGWKLERIQETEISSYISGGVKQDVNESSFTGFTL
jgi:hypothetical protein